MLVRRCKESYILVGTATGHLQVHSDSGVLLHRQRLHTSAVTSLRMRVAGMHVSADDAAEDVTVCFEDAAACFSSIEVSCGSTWEFKRTLSDLGLPSYISTFCMVRADNIPVLFGWLMPAVH